jgi:hypothetical protein
MEKVALFGRPSIIKRTLSEQFSIDVTFDSFDKDYGLLTESQPNPPVKRTTISCNTFNKRKQKKKLARKMRRI